MSEITKNDQCLPVVDQSDKHIACVSSESAISMAIATKARRNIVKGSENVSYQDELQASHRVAREQVNDIASGDMTSLISRLNGQLDLLETAFATWTSRALDAKHIDQATKLMNTAMRIQSNMRMTAQTICDIKHPRQQVNFVHAEQANLAQNQQINNTRE